MDPPCLFTLVILPLFRPKVGHCCYVVETVPIRMLRSVVREVMMAGAAFGGAIKDGGGSVTIVAGDASRGAGGVIRLLSGHSVQGSSGSVDMATSDASSSGVSGSLSIRSGASSGGESGTILLSTGQATDAAGGGISLIVGTGDSNDGGDVTIVAGITIALCCCIDSWFSSPSEIVNERQPLFVRHFMPTPFYF